MNDCTNCDHSVPTKCQVGTIYTCKFFTEAYKSPETNCIGWVAKTFVGPRRVIEITNYTVKEKYQTIKDLFKRIENTVDLELAIGSKVKVILTIEK